MGGAKRDGAAREALETIELFRTQLAVVQLLISVYLGQDLDEETFLSDFRIMVPDYSAGTAEEWTQHLPSDVCEEMRRMILELNQNVLPDVLWFGRLGVPSFGRPGIAQRLIVLDQRLEEIAHLVMTRIEDEG